MTAFRPPGRPALPLLWRRPAIRAEPTLQAGEHRDCKQDSCTRNPGLLTSILHSLPCRTMKICGARARFRASCVSSLHHGHRRVASALSAAAKVPGATQRTKNTYDLSTIERTLATERDACGVGFVAESAAGPSRRVIIAATAACDANEHRGGCSSDCVSGDGAGIMTQIPWAVYEKSDTPRTQSEEGTEPGRAARRRDALRSGDAEAAARASELPYEAASLTGFEVVAWRDIPIDPSICGETAAAAAGLRPCDFATAADVPERDP